tara:strand:+ start:492 stop:647 length:156 start_codon:yes stop_codon:yes gene_type:complete
MLNNSEKETASAPSKDQAKSAYVLQMEAKMLEIADEVLRLKRKLSRLEGMR